MSKIEFIIIPTMIPMILSNQMVISFLLTMLVLGRMGDGIMGLVTIR